jgi:serine/threonine-protein kinase RsbW
MNQSVFPRPAGSGHPDPTHVAWAGIPADPHGATWARTTLAQWLGHHLALGDDRTGDVVLAVYEALANAVEAGTSTESTMDLTAAYDTERRTLVVTVIDRGAWPSSPPVSNSAAPVQRGRGLPLMRALADHTRIDTDDGGTAVALTWTDVPAVRADHP